MSHKSKWMDAAWILYIIVTLGILFFWSEGIRLNIRNVMIWMLPVDWSILCAFVILLMWADFFMMIWIFNKAYDKDHEKKANQDVLEQVEELMK